MASTMSGSATTVNNVYATSYLNVSGNKFDLFVYRDVYMSADGYLPDLKRGQIGFYNVINSASSGYPTVKTPDASGPYLVFALADDTSKISNKSGSGNNFPRVTFFGKYSSGDTLIGALSSVFFIIFRMPED